jgi:hypothetical protein
MALLTVTVPIKEFETQGLGIKTQAFARWLKDNHLQVMAVDFRFIVLAADTHTPQKRGAQQ